MAGKRGRPSKEPTEAEREKVKELVRVETPIADIAKLLNRSVPTIRKFFSRELFSEKKIKKSGSTFVPTAAHREKVARYIGCKEKIVDVARVIGCTEDELKEHFAEEIAVGRAKARAMVLDAYFDQMADGITGATNRLEALTAPVLDDQGKGTGVPSPTPSGYVGKKFAAARAADAAVAAGGKFAPRGAPRLAVVGGKAVPDEAADE